MQEWRRRLDALADVPEPAEPASRVFLSEMLDGRGGLDGDLDAEDHAIVATALRVATADDAPGEPARTPDEQRAERGGPTRLDNLVLLCRRHHTLIHRPGWSDKLLPDGTYEVTDPRGRVWQTRPSGVLGF